MESTTAFDFQCDHCGRTFAKKGYFDKHIQRVHTFKCDHCSDVLPSKEIWLLHLTNEHAMVISTMCHICNKIFNNAKAKERHVKQCLSLICNVCGKTFTQKTSLERHMDNIHSQKCSHCDEEFTSRRLLIDHKTKHHAICSELRCDICNMSFSRKDNFTKHISRIHTFKCEYCHELLTSEDALAKHWADEHFIMSTYECYVCSRIFPTEDLVDEHISEEHVYICETCGEHFHTEKQKLRHTVNEHEKGKESVLDKPKPIRCGHCEIVLSTWRYFKEHTKQFHPNSDRLFKCTSCDLTFSSIRRLDNHVRIHNRKDNYEFIECQICKSAFRRVYGLRRHYKSVHPNEKLQINQYKCTECPMIFKSRHRVRKHVKIHNKKGEEYECIDCKDCFKTEDELEAHLETHRDLGNSDDDEDFKLPEVIIKEEIDISD
ncbi:hypothetical protein ACFFRR_011088 [Megaselia abdita]